jgi:hypothetical protein
MKKLFAVLLAMGLAAAVQAQSVVCGSPETVNLIAGRSIDAGDVVIANDESFIYVTFIAVDGWQITETHVAVASSLGGIPQTRSGNPRIGNFPYAGTHNGVSTVVYAIPRNSLPASDCFVVAAHAVVGKSSGFRFKTETAWGQGPTFPGRSWAMYTTYCTEPCDEAGEPDA